MGKNKNKHHVNPSPAVELGKVILENLPGHREKAEKPACMQTEKVEQASLKKAHAGLEGKSRESAEWHDKLLRLGAEFVAGILALESVVGSGPNELAGRAVDVISDLLQKHPGGEKSRRLEVIFGRGVEVVRVLGLQPRGCLSSRSGCPRRCCHSG